MGQSQSAAGVSPECRSARNHDAFHGNRRAFGRLLGSLAAVIQDRYASGIIHWTTSSDARFGDPVGIEVGAAKPLLWVPNVSNVFVIRGLVQGQLCDWSGIDRNASMSLLTELPL
jgi:hypothetical protein